MYSIIDGIMNNYSHFFSLKEIIGTLSDPANWGVILSLIVLEGLLSSDNALVLAVMVRHLPERKQRKALFYGIVGAYTFRFIAIGLGTYLIKIWWMKLIGGLYLLYLTIKFFYDKYYNPKDENKDGISDALQKGLFATIISVELMDMAFSIDSVMAAFGLSEKVWVLFLGGIFGIAMMRGIAKTFVKLINKIPELETAAYLLIFIIGSKMVSSLKGLEIPDITFFGLLMAIFSGTIVYHYIRRSENDIF